jgi:hypothetical protein
MWFILGRIVTVIGFLFIYTRRRQPPRPVRRLLGTDTRTHYRRY